MPGNDYLFSVEAHGPDKAGGPTVLFDMTLNEPLVDWASGCCCPGPAGAATAG